jgi:transcriptional regulator with XRE-family HTH domain
MTNHVTNQEFADAIDVHFTMASRLRNGQRRPSVIKMRRIADAYQLPMDELLAAYYKGRKPDGHYYFADYLNSKLDQTGESSDGDGTHSPDGDGTHPTPASA